MSVVHASTEKEKGGTASRKHSPLRSQQAAPTPRVHHIRYARPLQEPDRSHLGTETLWSDFMLRNLLSSAERQMVQIDRGEHTR